MLQPLCLRCETRPSSARPAVRKKAGRPAAIARLGAALGRISHRFRGRHDGNDQLRSVTGAARFTGCSTGWGARRLARLGGPIAAELPRITHLATAGKHRHQQEDQHAQLSHPTGLLSWQVSSLINSWRSREIVRHDSAHATQIEAPHPGFYRLGLPTGQDALPGETLPEENPSFSLRLQVLVSADTRDPAYARRAAIAIL